MVMKLGPGLKTHFEKKTQYIWKENEYKTNKKENKSELKTTQHRILTSHGSASINSIVNSSPSNWMVTVRSISSAVI